MHSKYEHLYYGYIQSKFDIQNSVYFIFDINTKYTPKLKAYQLSTGNEIQFKMFKNKLFKNSDYDNPNENQLLNVYDGAIISKFREMNKSIKVNDEWVETGEIELFVDSFTKITY